MSEEDKFRKENQKWENDIEYFLVHLGTCVGYGCLWRFPYILFTNGGGVFLIPFFIMQFLIGIPVTLLEVALGQYFKKPIIDTYEKYSIKFKGIGIHQVIAMAFTSIYYIMIMCWSLMYMMTAFSVTLPWEVNKEQDPNHEINLIKRTSDYFYNNILGLSVPMGEIGGFNIKLLIYFFITWVVIYACIRNGIKQTGKIAYFTVIAPYVLIFILQIRVCFLEGSFYGMKFQFVPNFSKLLTVQIWSEAATQALFQYSLGIGVGVTFARFRAEGESINRPPVLMCIINILTGILNSLVVFGYLGHYCYQNNIGFDSLPIAGSELVFVTYPAIFTKMYLPNQWVFLFFFTMVLLGIDTQFANVEVVSCYIDDLKPKWKGKLMSIQSTKLISCLFLFAVGVIQCTEGGFYIFLVYDNYIFRIPSAVATLGNLYMVMYCSDYKKFFEQLCEKANEKPMYWALFVLKYISPITFTIFIILGILHTEMNIIQEYTFWLNVMGHFCVLLTILPTFAYLILYRNSPVDKSIYDKSQGENPLEIELLEKHHQGEQKSEDNNSLEKNSSNNNANNNEITYAAKQNNMNNITTESQNEVGFVRFNVGNLEEENAKKFVYGIQDDEGKLEHMKQSNNRNFKCT